MFLLLLLLLLLQFEISLSFQWSILQKNTESNDVKVKLIAGISCLCFFFVVEIIFIYYWKFKCLIIVRFALSRYGWCWSYVAFWDSFEKWETFEIFTISKSWLKLNHLSISQSMKIVIFLFILTIMKLQNFWNVIILLSKNPKTSKN